MHQITAGPKNGRMQAFCCSPHAVILVVPTAVSVLLKYDAGVPGYQPGVRPWVDL